MSPPKSLARILWEHGKSLSRAYPYRSPEELHEGWKTASEAPILADLAKHVSEASDAAQFFRKLGEINSPRLELSREIEENARRAMTSSQVISVGFEPRRKLDSEPVAIPAEAWRRGADWRGSRLKIAGLEFIEIRILTRKRADEIAADQEATHYPAHPAPRRGPRGAATDIAEAFEALSAAGRIDPASSTASHYPMIREWLRHHRPDGGYSDSKPSDETLRKTVSPMLAEAKARQSDCPPEFRSKPLVFLLVPLRALNSSSATTRSESHEPSDTHRRRGERPGSPR